jgi:transcriptional regulator with XRE-family HTH domain
MLDYARLERARLPAEALTKRFPKLSEWESGAAKPTLRQLEEFASATTTPLGYLFLPEPPEEALPIPDFRTVADRPIGRPSPNLLDTVFEMQVKPGCARRREPVPAPLCALRRRMRRPRKMAIVMRRALGVSAGWADVHSTWSDALRGLRDRIEAVGIIVVVNGVVGNNNYRKLDPEEFRGFVLTDQYAPLIFVNGADGRAAQMFTLAHELAHLWIG